MRLPGQRQKNFITHSTAQSRGISILISVFLTPNSHRIEIQSGWVWSGWVLAYSVGRTENRSPDFRNPESLIVGRKLICTLLQTEPIIFIILDSKQA